MNDMKNAVINQIILLIGWVATAVILLWPQISWQTVVVIGAGALALALGCVAKAREQKEEQFTQYLDMYLGIMCIVLMGGYLLQINNWESRLLAMVTSGVILREIANFLLIFFRDHFLALVLVIAAGILKILLKKIENVVLGVIADYLLSWTVFCCFYYWATEGRMYNSFLETAVALLFILVTLMKRVNGLDNRSFTTVWFWVVNGIYSLSGLYRTVDLNEFYMPGYIAERILSQGFSLRNTIFLSVIWLAAAGVIYGIALEEEDALGIKSYWCLWVIATIPMTVYFLNHFYTGYWWILFMAYYICMCAVMAGYGSTKENTEKNRYKKYQWMVLMVILPFALIYMLRKANCGKLLSACALLIGCLMMAGVVWDVVFDISATERDRSIKTAVTCVISIALVTAARVYESRMKVEHLVLLVFVTVLFAVFLVIVGRVDSDGLTLFQNRLLGTSSVALFLIFCLVLSFKGGCSVEIHLNENQQAEVSVTARGKENGIAEIEAKWTDDPMKEILINKKTELPEAEPYQDVSEEMILPVGNGKLTIEATDTFGRKTTVTQWFHHLP